MRGLFTKQWLAIEAGRAVSGIAGRAQTLRIRHGRVWLTVEGAGHDYWLSAGDSFAVAPGRLVVVEADRDGSCVEVTPGHHRSMMAHLRALARRFSAGTGARAGLQQGTLASCRQCG